MKSLTKFLLEKLEDNTFKIMADNTDERTMYDKKSLESLLDIVKSTIESDILPEGDYERVGGETEEDNW